MINISVIVPMYNAKDYIVSCINGILSQSAQNIEVVVVNDCSTDGCMEMCREIFGENENVQLIDQPYYMGPGEARNIGIQHARGKYITFVDSDDAIRQGAYKEMLAAALKYDADVLHVTGVIMQTVDEAPLDINELTEDEVFHVTLDEGNKRSECGLISDCMEERLSSWLSHELHWAIWNKLYKRSFLLDNNILFGKMKFAEDQVFSFHCLCHAKNYVVLPGEWYLYRIGGESLSRGRKGSAFMIKAITAQLDMPEYMNKAMTGIDYFEQNPEKKKEAIEYVYTALENGFVVPTFKDAGIEALRNDEKLHETFVDYFGERAEFVEKQFYMAHEDIPEGDSIYDAITTPAFWRNIKEAQNANATN